jgi:predicted permease
MDVLTFGLRDAFRSFRRDCGYAATVVVTLALTIGATTAVFSIVDGVLLRPLAYRESDRLVALREVWRELSNRIPVLEVNEQHFEYWRTHTSSLASLAQYTAISANLTGRGEATQLSVVRCSGALFEVLQVQPAIGRLLVPQDEGDEAADVVVLSDTLWQQRFGADPRIVGQAITLDGKPYLVVGITPASFRLPRRNPMAAPIDAFVPLHLTVGWVGDHNNEAIGRLKPGVTLEQVQAELDLLQKQVSEIATQRAQQTVTLASVVTPLADYIVGSSRRGLFLLLAAILAVLLIACANLANLSLTRALRRLRDAAIRSALGAGRRRLLGHVLAEQLLLSVTGGAFGLAVAWGALRVFVRTAPIDLPRVNEVGLDARVLTFTAAISIFTGLLVAMVPAWRMARRGLDETLRSTAAAVASDRVGLRSHAALLALQVGVSVTLLVTTALLVASFLRVLNIDRGFVADRVLAVDVALPGTRYADEPVRQAAYDRMLAAIQALPGVTSASTTSLLPLRGSGQVNFIAREGSTLPVAELPSANFRFIAPDFFRTMGIALRRGRPFGDAERDPDRPLPAVVSELTAARVWPGEDPIGKRFNRGQTAERYFEVVGVAADARTTSLERDQPLMVYVPYWWRSRTSVSLLVKSSLEPSSIVPEVRPVMHDIDPEIAVGQSQSLDQLVDASMAARRYQVQLFVAFGLVALFIATLGVYAVTAYSVSRRRREMNVRVALGASVPQVIGLVLKQGMTPVMAGLIAGAVGALAVGGLVASLLFEVRARDPLMITAVVATVGAVGLTACVLAARRGLFIDLATALREE